MGTDCVGAEVGTEVTVETWDDCEKKIQSIEKCYDQPYFRGHSDSTWELLSTLDRRRSQDMTISKYYRLVQQINPEIEAFTGKSLEVPLRNEEALRLVFSGDPKSLQKLLESGYSCMAHLRHYGFPSPLLDWTASPYVAAYFAFAGPIEADHVAIYVYVERPYNIKIIDIASDTPQISTLGPIVRTHPRHFRQQSRYTVCAKFRDQSGWTFVPHQTVFKLPATRQQDFLWKISVPASERVKVLSMLDRYNLNAYSLFGSEESLMETLALRYLDKS
jgi:FRG domain